MITVSQLSKHYGAKTLFDAVTLQLNAGCRYGLVGANGSGKTTFLKILTGDEGADGAVSYAKNLRLGILRQDQFLNDDERILDVAMQGDSEVYSALIEQESLSNDSMPDADRLIYLNDVITQHDGYTLEARAHEVLVGLGIGPDQVKQPLGTLSGGFKLRVLLGRVLVSRPDALLLDEPTNHLDILSIRWLEQFLQNYRGCAVIISHDRRFLDAVATRILDVDYETILDYPGNYTSFLEQKEGTRDRKEAEIAKVEKAIAQKKAFVERFKAKASKARQAQSRVKQIEKIEIERLPLSSRRHPRFKFQQVRPSGRDVLSVEELSKAYGDNKVLSNVGFSVRRGEHVAIIGANGVGKSTLLKILTDHLPADSGKHEWGHEVKVGYFAQDHHELLADPKSTPLAFVWDACPAETTSYVRGQLGRVLFTGDEVEKKVEALSGGEAARVVFARLAVERPNVLVLDEPTNHLDLEAIEALTDALREYQGTLLFVSHDRHFVSQLATRIIEVRKDGLHDFMGTYDEYVDRRGDDHLDVETVVLKAKTEKKAVKKSSSSKESKKTSSSKQLQKRRDELITAIERAETEKRKLLERYASPGYFEKTSTEDQRKLEERRIELESTIEAHEKQWEDLEAELNQG